MTVGIETAVAPSLAARDMDPVKRDVVVLADQANFGWSAEGGHGAEPPGMLTHVIDAQSAILPIGSVAISDSNDVHFGAKTYIHGPVTIKQFINEFKQSGEGGHDNPNFVRDKSKLPEENGDGGANAFQVDAPPHHKTTCMRHNKWTWKKKTAIGVTIAVAFLIILFISIEQSKSDDSKDTDKVLLLSKKLRMISRAEWLAQPSGIVEPLTKPAKYVIIAHTATENCKDQASCTFQVRTIQTYHIESRSWSDIGYNFIVGGDGSVYEGRGWDTMGAHTKGYNDISIGIGLIGTFIDVLPPERQLEATKKLIELGVEKGKIIKDYKLFGHRQLIPSISPGNVLFSEIEKWPHFSSEL